jgi:hypothetical protein
MYKNSNFRAILIFEFKKKIQWRENKMEIQSSKDLYYVYQPCK